MKRIAVFGKPGGGKSTFSKELSTCTGIKVHSLDLIEYKKDGQQASAEEYLLAHEKLINSESWIIDGLGSMKSFWSRIEAADTLIFIDLPYAIHYWWVTKRLLTSLIKKPEGWPEGSSILKGTITSWKHLRLSPKFWTSDFFDKIIEKSSGKKVYRITKPKELKQFIEKQQKDRHKKTL